MAEVQCVGCNGSGRIHRGYDGLQIRCPECLGLGKVPEEYANRPRGPGDAISRRPAARRPAGGRNIRPPARYLPEEILEEILERRRAAEQDRLDALARESSERRSASHRGSSTRPSTPALTPTLWVLFQRAWSSCWYRLRRLLRPSVTAPPRGRRGRRQTPSSWGWFRVGLIPREMLESRSTRIREQFRLPSMGLVKRGPGKMWRGRPVGAGPRIYPSTKSVLLALSVLLLAGSLALGFFWGWVLEEARHFIAAAALALFVAIFLMRYARRGWF